MDCWCKPWVRKRAYKNRKGGGKSRRPFFCFFLAIATSYTILLSLPHGQYRKEFYHYEAATNAAICRSYEINKIMIWSPLYKRPMQDCFRFAGPVSAYLGDLEGSESASRRNLLWMVPIYIYRPPLKRTKPFIVPLTQSTLIKHPN